MRSVRRVGEAGTHPTSTDHVSGPIQTASNGETVGKNQVNSLYTAVEFYYQVLPRYSVCVSVIRRKINEAYNASAPVTHTCTPAGTVSATPERKGSRKVDTFSIYACHPCAGAMLIFSVSFQV